MSDIKYIPVYLAGTPMLSKKYNIGEYALNNISNNAYELYPYALISAYHSIKIEDFKKEFDINKEIKIYGDSGGYQNMTLNAILDPIKVLRWQEQNCDYGFIFDYPIFSDDNKQTIIDKQAKTVENAFVALENRINKNLKIIAVVQGHTPKQINNCLELYEKKGGLKDFDVISIGGLVPISGNINKLSQILTYFITQVAKYKKPIHFLGISNEQIVYIIKYLSLKFDLLITFDSSSAFSGARYGRYYKTFKNSTYYKELDFNNINCNCFGCNKLKELDFKSTPDWLIGSLLTLHNIKIFINTIKEINELNIEELRQNINVKFLNQIDNIINNGFKYADYLMPTEYKYDQKTIFNY